MLKMPFDPNKPILGESSVVINKPIDETFEYIAEHFFDNYPKWAVDLIALEPLDGREIFVGAKAQQVRRDQGKEVKSTFQVSDYQPTKLFSCKGISAEYVDHYQFDAIQNGSFTQLTYTFELLNVELFMRPFEKLIRVAIEDGAETTTDNIKSLLSEVND